MEFKEPISFDEMMIGDDGDSALRVIFGCFLGRSRIAIESSKCLCVLMGYAMG